MSVSMMLMIRRSVKKYEDEIPHIRGRAWLIHFRTHGTINFVMLLVRLQGFPGPIVTHKRHGVNLAKLLSGFERLM